MAPRHLFLMFIICLVWGFTFVAGKAGVSEIPPMLFTALRYLLLSLLLFPFLQIVPGRMPQIIFISMAMGSAHFSLFYGGMSIADNVSSIAVAVQLSVPISTIMSIVFLNEQVGWRRWTGIAMSFGGVVIISFDPAIVSERLGLIMVVGAAFIGSAGTIVMKQIERTGVYQMQAWIAILSWPPLIALSLVFESNHIAVLQNASWMAWGGVVYTAVGASLIGHAGMYYLLQRYDVSVTSPLTLMAPIFGIMSGVIFWGDQLGLRFWIGGGLALLGVLIIGLRKREVAHAGSVL
jgi:O-acetylserine/cysteine efflux transporter